MADIRYDVSRLFQLAFGVNSPVFVPYPFVNTAPPNIDFSGLEIIRDYTDLGDQSNFYNDNRRLSWMGTPIVFQAEFQRGSYQIYENGQLRSKPYESFRLPPATMFSFRRAKNIIRTNVLGADGTVKEIFGFDDWIIDVRGLCLDEPNRSAKAQLKELLQWEKIADSIGISGSQFALRNINNVCISEWQDNVPQGKPGVIAYQFQLLSDEPLELALRV